MFNLATAIYRYSIETPDALAISYRGSMLTYKQLAERVRRVAIQLQQSWPPRRIGDPLPRVGILASRSIDACVAMLAACWSGATYVPLGLKTPEERLELIMPMCGLSALIVDDDGLKLLSESVIAKAPDLIVKCSTNQNTSPVQTKKRIVAELQLPISTVFEPAAITAEDIAYIIFTSGTTGLPKGVMIPANAVRDYVSTIADYLELTSSDRVLETCEMNFDFSVHNMFSTWSVGASLHILPASEVINSVRFARTEALTVWNSVPSLAGMLNQVKALKPGALDQLRATVFGGEQLPSGVVTVWQTAAPNSKIFNLYGPTEATVFCLAALVTDLRQTGVERDVISIGRPLAGNDASIFDETGQEVANGEVGELAISGCQLAEGYLDDPVLTSKRFPWSSNKRWYLTGDNAILDKNGNFCVFRRT